MMKFKAASPFSPTQPVHTVLAVFLAVIMAATVGTALGFEYIGGYIPCDLCLKERIPYYIGVPLMLVAAILSACHCPGAIVRGLFIILAFLMVYNCGLSIYHAGAEYGFWAGPSTCSSGNLHIVNDASDLLGSLSKVIPPACDKAAGYFLGISFAGWNVIATFFIAIISFIGAFIAEKK